MAQHYWPVNNAIQGAIPQWPGLNLNLQVVDSQAILDAIQELRETLQDTNEKVQEMSDTIQEMNEKVQEMSETVQEMSETVDGLNDTVQDIESRVQEIDDKIDNLTERMKASTRNQTARIQNSTRNMVESSLVPLVDPETGKPIKGFPATVAALNAMPSRGVKAILNVLEEEETGTEAERRQRLRDAIGVVTRP